MEKSIQNPNVTERCEASFISNRVPLTGSGQICRLMHFGYMWDFDSVDPITKGGDFEKRGGVVVSSSCDVGLTRGESVCGEFTF